MLKLFSCSIVTPSPQNDEIIAQMWCIYRAVGVFSSARDVSLPDKRLAPRLLLRQDSFLALCEGPFSAFTVRAAKTIKASTLQLECDLRCTLLPPDRLLAPQDYFCYPRELSSYSESLVKPVAGDVVIVRHHPTDPNKSYAFFVIPRSPENLLAWNRSELTQDPRWKSQKSVFERSTFDSFLTSLSRPFSPDVQEQFLKFFEQQSADVQESFMHVSFAHIHHASHLFYIMRCNYCFQIFAARFRSCLIFLL